MDVKIVLDEEEEFLVSYYAETKGVSVEEAFKDAIMEKIRALYEAQEAENARPRVKFEVEPEEHDSDDIFADEDR